MKTYRIRYDVDRGGMPGDGVEVIVRAGGLLRAVRMARSQVYSATDCIERLTLIDARPISTDQSKERVLSTVSDLFGHS